MFCKKWFCEKWATLKTCCSIMKENKKWCDVPILNDLLLDNKMSLYVHSVSVTIQYLRNNFLNKNATEAASNRQQWILVLDFCWRVGGQKFYFPNIVRQLHFLCLWEWIWDLILMLYSADPEGRVLPSRFVDISWHWSFSLISLELRAWFCCEELGCIWQWGLIKWA